MGSINDNESSTTINSDAAPVPDTDIAHDGDVILIVGAEEARLRAHSVILRTASRVFNAMFGPNWKEGQGLSAQNPSEVAMEEDDAEAFRTILYILHHRSSEVPEALTALQIANIAVECNKYDLVDALKYSSTHWLKTTRDECLLSMGHLMAAAYLFRNTDMFAAHTLELIMRYEGDYMKLLDVDIISQLLPIQIVCLLEQRRTAMKAELGRVIDRGSDVLLCACLRRAGRATLEPPKNGFGSLALQFGVAGILDESIEDIIESIETILQGEVSCDHWIGVMHKCADHEDSFPIELEAIKKRAAICIDCVRRGSACRFQHI